MQKIICFLLFLIIFHEGKSQIPQPIYMGESSWKRVANQKKPELLPVTEHPVTMTKKLIPNPQKKTFQRKIDPTTKIIKVGATIPVAESLQFKGKKISIAETLIAPSLLFRDNTSFNISYTDKQHGFAGKSTSDFAEDNEHNIWMASDNGLIKYDGYHYYVYNQLSGLPNMIIESLLYDSQQRLWLGSDKGVYYIKHDSLFSVQSESIDFTMLYCRKIQEDRYHRVWLSTKENGAICIDNNNIQIFDKRCGLPTNYVHTTFIDNKGDLYFGLWDNGLVKVLPDKMIYLFSDSKQMQYHDITAIMENEAGIWLGGFSCGLIQMGKKDTIQYSLLGNYHDRIYDFEPAPNGFYFSLYGIGLCYYNSTQPLLMTETNGLQSKSAYYLFTDSYQNIWIADLVAGFSRLNENNFYVQPYENSAMGLVQNIIPDRKNGSWILTEGNGLLYKNESSIAVYQNTLQNGIQPMLHPLDGVVNDDGSIWLSSYGAGMVLGKNLDFRFYRYSAFWENEIIFSVKKDFQQKVWFSTMRYGVIVHDQNKFYRYHTGSGLLGNDPSKLFLDKENKIICSFKNGVQKLTDDGIETLYIDNAPFRIGVNGLLVTKDNGTILATERNGLVIIQNNKVFQINKESGLSSNKIKSIIQDKNSKIWITTDIGMENFYFENNTITEHHFYSQNNGLYLLNASAVILDNDGFPFWSLGNKKIVYNPLFDRPEKKPNFYIQKIFVDDKETIPNQQINILPKQKINIHFTAIAWGRENNIEMNYLLISNSGDTSKRSIGNRGNILISDLLPGKYKILLSVKDNNSFYYSTPILFTIKNYWYNTWAFRFILFLLIVSCIYLLFRQKSIRQRKINELLKIKVAEQTALIFQEKEELIKSNRVIETQIQEKDILLQEVHHRVKNNLQFIAAMVEMQLKSEKSNLGILIPLQGTKRRITAMAMVHEMLYGNIHSERLSAKQYITELVNYLKEMDSDFTNPIQFNVELEDCIIDSRSAIAIGMIISELVSNSLKHAFQHIEKPEVRIEFKKIDENGMFQLLVSDNGNGIVEMNASKAGLGTRLINIFTRQLQGTFSIDHNHQFHFILSFKPELI